MAEATMEIAPDTDDESMVDAPPAVAAAPVVMGYAAFQDIPAAPSAFATAAGVTAATPALAPTDVPMGDVGAAAPAPPLAPAIPVSRAPQIVYVAQEPNERVAMFPFDLTDIDDATNRVKNKIKYVVVTQITVIANEALTSEEQELLPIVMRQRFELSENTRVMRNEIRMKSNVRLDQINGNEGVFLVFNGQSFRGAESAAAATAVAGQLVSTAPSRGPAIEAAAVIDPQKLEKWRREFTTQIKSAISLAQAKMAFRGLDKTLIVSILSLFETATGFQRSVFLESPNELSPVFVNYLFSPSDDEPADLDAIRTELAGSVLSTIEKARFTTQIDSIGRPLAPTITDFLSKHTPKIYGALATFWPKFAVLCDRRTLKQTYWDDELKYPDVLPFICQVAAEELTRAPQQSRALTMAQTRIFEQKSLNNWNMLVKIVTDKGWRSR